MNNQEIFNKVLTNLRAQGRRSMIGDRCCYRGSNGDKCAIGHLIADEDYHVLMEGHSIESLSKDLFTVPFGSIAYRFNRALQNIGVDIFDADVRRLLTLLQHAHDSAAVNGWLAWEGNMKQVAEHCGLEYKPV